MAAAIDHSGVEPNQLNQRQLDAISVRCASPCRWLQNRGGTIHLRPSRTAQYEKIDCVLGELRRLHSGPMGFVGNESFEAEKPK
ncbi:hypothetical protein [Sphingomonas profundi]|uniref:hypothetical protein n=1 Tax=Alterirhizorhabdus profundi TaxID=2681549 RepID=UPI0012E931FB|nr:hypothetical protein [Sphingomonas profundi]